MNETSIELAKTTQINELHKEAERLATSAKEHAHNAIAIAVQCGNLLIECKKSIGHGNWLGWVDGHLEFCERTARRYMALSRRTNELEEYEASANESSNRTRVSDLERIKAKTLRQAYIATGILPETPKFEVEKLSGPKFPHVKHIDYVVLWYREVVETNPAKNWTARQRDVLINDLAPLMEIYNELINIQESLAQ